MKTFEWLEEHSVGIPDIDNQHKKFMQIINDLYEAMAVGKGPVILQDVMRRLFQHCETHFAAEEQYMKQVSYPGLAEHRRRHKDLVETLSVFKKKERDSSPQLFTVELAFFLRDWFYEHVRDDDQKFFAYWREHHTDS